MKKKRLKKRKHEVSNATLAKRIAAYHAANLRASLVLSGLEQRVDHQLSGIALSLTSFGAMLERRNNHAEKAVGMIRDLTLRIDRALTALYEEKEFVDRLTEKLPVNGPVC